MATATAYLDRVLPAIDRLAERFAALATSAPDPSAPIPGSAWTVRDATAHVVTVARRFSDGPKGRGIWVPDPRDLAALNDTQIQALAGLDMPALADRLRCDLTALAAQVRAYGTAPPSFRFPSGPTSSAAACSPGAAAPGSPSPWRTGSTPPDADGRATPTRVRLRPGLRRPAR